MPGSARGLDKERPSETGEKPRALAAVEMPGGSRGPPLVALPWGASSRPSLNYLASTTFQWLQLVGWGRQTDQPK